MSGGAEAQGSAMTGGGRDAGRITAIDVVRNPDKLRGLVEPDPGLAERGPDAEPKTDR